MARDARVKADNRRLADNLRALKQLVNRYEHAYMSGTEAVATSVQQHQRIATALRDGELDRAVRALEESWRQSLDRFLGHLRRERDAAPHP